MVTMTLSRINELANEVLDIEANSILRLKSNIGESFEKAIDILYNVSTEKVLTPFLDSILLINSCDTPTRSDSSACVILASFLYFLILPAILS